eukprot:gene7191-7762_t
MTSSPRCSWTIPHDEEKRLQLIQDLNILQHYQDDERFQRITLLAAEYYKCPIALITVVGEKTIWFLSKIGLEEKEATREFSFCQYAILPETSNLFIVQDALKDERFKQSPIVTGAPHLRFYAASSIHLQDVKIGTISILDIVPHEDFDEEKGRRLQELAHTISDMIFEKKLEFLQEENMTMDIIQNINKDIVTNLQAMVRTQNELQHLHRLLFPSAGNNSNVNNSTPTGGTTGTPPAGKNHYKKTKSLKLIVDLEEVENSLERSKHELLEKRLLIQQLLQKGLQSVDNIKRSLPKHSSRKKSLPPAVPIALKPDHSFVRGEYISIDLWFTKLKESIIKTIPNYGIYASHVKWEIKLPITEPDQGYEMNEGNMHFLTHLLSLLFISLLQKWKYIKLGFYLFPIKEIHPGNMSTRNSMKPLKKQALTISTDEEDEYGFPNQPAEPLTSVAAISDKKGVESQFDLLHGKICVEVKGYGKLPPPPRPPSLSPTPTPTSDANENNENVPNEAVVATPHAPINASPTDTYPLFPEENQFFSICDNFISNAFQIIQGEFQKYHNRNEEITNFWVACFMKDVILPPPNSNVNGSNGSGKSVNSKGSRRSFIARLSRAGTMFNLSINNLLNNDWFYRNNSRRSFGLNSMSETGGNTPTAKSSKKINSSKYAIQEDDFHHEDYDHQEDKKSKKSTVRSQDKDNTVPVEEDSENKSPNHHQNHRRLSHSTNATKSMKSVVQFFFPSKSNKVHISSDEEGEVDEGGVVEKK